MKKKKKLDIYSVDAVSRKLVGQFDAELDIRIRKGKYYSVKDYNDLIDICLSIEQLLVEAKQQLQSRFNLS